MSQLWISLEPEGKQLHLSLSKGLFGNVMRARLPLTPAQPRAMKLLLEGLVDWFGQPLCAVLDAEAEDVRRRPAAWNHLLELDDPRFRVEWVTLPFRHGQRERFLGAVGRERRARSLVSFAASGRR
jgi:hypothetical protein